MKPSKRNDSDIEKEQQQGYNNNQIHNNSKQWLRPWVRILNENKLMSI